MQHSYAAARPRRGPGSSLAAFLLFAFLILAPAVGRAQVTLSAAVNGASYLNSSLPNGKLAQGVLFIAFGQGMGPASIERANAFPLPTTLAGTSVSVTVGGVTKPCIMLYSLAGQVAAILPSDVPTGNGTMVLTYNGVSSAPLAITVVTRAFGAFALNQGGSGPGVFLDPFTSTANSLTTAANPGAPWDIWGSGLGAVTGDEAAGPLPGDITDADVKVFFGSVEAQVVYRGRSGCCAGVDQIRVIVPAVSGCYVPVYILVDGVISNFVSMSVAEAGSTCSNPFGYDLETYQQLLSSGQLRLGVIILNRFYAETKTISYQGDSAVAGFSALAVQDLASNMIPQPGACVVIQFPTPTVPIPVGLDAGAQVPMMSPMGNYNLVPPAFGGSVGQYSIAFSPSSAGAPPTPGIITDGTVLQPGSYSFLVPGGADVGPVDVNMNLPVKFDWTNPIAAGSTVSLGEELRLTWASASPDSLVFVNLQSQGSPGVGATVNCWFAPGSGSAVVPAAVMGALPPSYVDQSGSAQGTVSVYQFIRGDDFTATGIDIGIAQIGDGFGVGEIRFQ